MPRKKPKAACPSFHNAEQSFRARAAALEVLNRFKPKPGSTAAVLHEMLTKTTERQRTTDLVCGTIRNRSAIDTVIATLGMCPVKRILPKLLNIIRIGAYELIYSATTPEYSIVNEAVENAKAAAGRKHSGFVNGMLRQIERHIVNRQVALSEADTRRTLPQSPMSGCEFDTDILPHPRQAPLDYFRTAFSLPGWLVAAWLVEFGPETTHKICFASNRRPSVYVRHNCLKTTHAKLTEIFRQAGIEFELPGCPGPAQAQVTESANRKDLQFVRDTAQEPLIRIKSPVDISDLAGFAEGLFSVQDPTAALAARLLCPEPRQRILDLCAAPGTKTAQLAELTADQAEIIATDKDAKRMEKVAENIDRLGIEGVTIIPYEHLTRQTEQKGPFDSILLDVPCSNTGVLARRVELRHRLTPKTIASLTKVQSDLLATASNLLKPGGRICYSTCSIQEDENTTVVRSFLKHNPAFKLESQKLTLPSAEDLDCDGGYAALITGR